jgi:DNA polymerase-1
MVVFKPHLELVECFDDVQKMMSWAGERRETPLAFDCETEGLDVGRHRLRTIQLGDMHTGWCVPFDAWGGAALEILSKYQGDLVGHNSGFDHRFIKKYGDVDLPWHKIHDTLILAALDDSSRSRGLKPLSALLIDPSTAWGQQQLDEGMRYNGWDWSTVPVNFDPFWQYAALDTCLTAHLWKILYPRVEASCPSVYDLERGTARVVSRMMERGLLTDQPYIAETVERLRRESQEIRGWLQTAYGVTTPNSGPQIARAFASIGLEIDSYTATGQPRVDKEVLEYILKASDDPVITELARTVYAVRHKERMVSNYLENFMRMADPSGVIRCQIWTLTAKTGRMSVTEPALQTLHRDDKVVRGSFIPRPDHVFISCDFSQIEMRLAAAMSEDPGLIAAFAESDRGGLDFYSGVAQELFGEPVPKEDKRRQAVKTMSYAKLYGSGVATMARSIGLPESQVRPIHDAFNSRYPGLERLAKQTASAAWKMQHEGQQPAIILDSGRRLPVDREHAAINYKIQGTAAEVLKRAGLACEAAGLGDAMRLFIHDEILFEVMAKDAGRAVKVIENTMTDSSFSVPLTCSAKILPDRWVKS